MITLINRMKVWRLYRDSVESVLLWRFYGEISLEIVQR